MCTCAWMHACMCTCVRHPPKYPDRVPSPSTHPHPPMGDPWNQSKVNKNWMNQDIWILFEDFGSLNIFALIQTTLGVQVGGVPSQIAYFTFRPKNVHIFCSCVPPVKNFSVFTLESDRPCLDWQSIWFLTSWPIYNPFKSQLKIKTKVQNSTLTSILSENRQPYKNL